MIHALVFLLCAVPPSDHVDLILRDGSQTLRVRLHVLIDGKPYQDVQADAWDDYLKRLFAYLDANGDGVLDEKEAARMPQPLLQVPGTARRDAGPAFLAFNFRALDADGDGKVTPAEFAAYYKTYSGHSLQTLFAAPPVIASTTVGTGLFKLLDANGDGKLSYDELAAAESVLAKLDADGDELISAQEITGRLRADVPVGPVNADGRVTTLPAAFAVQVQAFEEAPDVEITVQLGDLPANKKVIDIIKCSEQVLARSVGDRLWLRVGKVQLDLRTNAGAPRPQADLLKQHREQFDAVAGPSGKLTLKEARSRNFHPRQFSLFDRDGDDVVTRAEFHAYLDEVLAPHMRWLTTRTTILLAPESRGLFDLLDVNRDGMLSLRELRNAPNLLPNREALLAAEDVPMSYPVVLGLGKASLSRHAGGGQPYTPPEAPLITLDWGGGGPLWFRKMDKNNDGDVSRREFLGSKEQFDKLDRNGDGLIGVDEAMLAEKDRKK